MTPTIRQALIQTTTRRAKALGLSSIDWTTWGELLECSNLVALVALDTGKTNSAVQAWLDSGVAGRERRLLAAINRRILAENR